MGKNKQVHIKTGGCGCVNPVVADVLVKKLNRRNVDIGLGDIDEEIKQFFPEIPIEPTTIFYNGTIRTMEYGDAEVVVEALAMKDGKIVDTGTLEELEEIVPSAKKVDLKGNTMLPAFIEPHTHPIISSIYDSWIQVTAFDGQELTKEYTLESCTKILKDNLEEYTINNWALAFGLDPALMQNGEDKEWRVPTKQYLDENVSSSVCIMIMNATGPHVAYVNSAALEAAGMESESGILLELPETMPMFEAAMLAQMEGSDVKTLLRTLLSGMAKKFNEAAALGMNVLYECGLAGVLLEYECPLLDAITHSGGSQIRYGGALVVTDIDDYHERSKWETFRPGLYNDEWFNVPYIKIVSDGSNQGLTGYQSEDYPNPDGVVTDHFPRGVWNMGCHAEYQYLVDTIVADGWDMMIHCNGDEALRRTLAVIQVTKEKHAHPSQRFRIEHSSLATIPEFATMAKLDVNPGFLIGHVGYWGHAFKTRVWPGLDKTEKLDLIKTSLNAGLRPMVHSDHFCGPMGPLRLIEQSITRIMEGDPNNEILVPEERLTMAEALRVVTYDAAWNCHMEQYIGELVKGKCADMVILPQDPMKTNAQGLRNIPVLETYVGGRKTYVQKVQKKSISVW